MMRSVGLLAIVCLISASVHAETFDQGKASYLTPDGKWRRASITVLPGKVEVFSRKHNDRVATFSQGSIRQEVKVRH